MLELDGSYGEGGGQILRTALSLSVCLGTPFRIKNIRKNRKKPGLMPQHLTGVRAMAAICGAHIEGASMGSIELLFQPEKSKPGTYRFDIGTAGSTTLLLQTLLPPLIFAGAPSDLVLTGGTHVPMSPPFDYIHDVFIPALKRLGVTIKASIERYGFYPKGGGKILVQVSPEHALDRSWDIDFIDQPKVGLIRGVSGVGNLPLSIAERQKTAAERALGVAGLATSIEVISVASPGPGAFIFLKPEGDTCLAGFSSIGERGKRAEKVGGETASALLEYGAARACLDPHLGDQIALYLALSPSAAAFTTSRITHHLLTNLRVIQQFLAISYTVDGEPGQPGRVTISGHISPDSVNRVS
jgi:RNA 3'-terminal phosphate cyclase (ATP)